MPKQWLLITLYMIFIFCVGLAAVQYVKRHPIVDEYQPSGQDTPASSSPP